MELNKITTDAMSLYGKPSLFYEMKDTIIYISYSNYSLLKSLIQNTISTSPIEDKGDEVRRYSPIINFVKNNDKLLSGDFLQSDPILFIESQNNYIAIQKDIKDVSIIANGIPKNYLSEDENDTIYTAIVESTELLSLNVCILDPIERFEIPVFAINIGK